MLKLIQMTVNDKPVELAVDERESLLDTLRNRLGLTSVKRGCEVGECGACTVLVDGEAIDSCIYLTVWAEGKHILTVEGLRGPNGELSPIQQAFIEEAAVQCGFCTPGLSAPAKSTAARSCASSSPATSAAAPAIRISSTRWNGSSMRPTGSSGNNLLIRSRAAPPRLRRGRLCQSSTLTFPEFVVIW